MPLTSAGYTARVLGVYSTGKPPPPGRVFTNVATLLLTCGAAAADVSSLGSRCCPPAATSVSHAVQRAARVEAGVDAPPLGSLKRFGKQNHYY